MADDLNKELMNLRLYLIILIVIAVIVGIFFFDPIAIFAIIIGIIFIIQLTNVMGYPRAEGVNSLRYIFYAFIFCALILGVGISLIWYGITIGNILGLILVSLAIIFMYQAISKADQLVESSVPPPQPTTPTATEQVPSGKSNFCPNCGQPVDSTNFCPNCGTKIN